MKVGIMALQGDVGEHVAALKSAMKQLHVSGSIVHVRRPSELEGVSALLMPGGESTTMARQLDRFGLRQAVIDFAAAGNPVMGTCAGCILLAGRILDRGEREVKPLGLMDIKVRRNAFGRQVESFERPLDIRTLEPCFPGVFIRAPRITEVGSSAESLAMMGEEHVMVRQGNMLALTFHPELAGDWRVHGLFLEMLRT